MEQTDGFLTSPSGVKFYTQEWKPSNPKAVIVLVHGLGEHSGRYQHVAAALGQAGYAMLGYDAPGHGKTSGSRGHIASYELVLELIDCMLAEAATRYPGLPRFLYGHSMGGNMVLYYAMKQKPGLPGIIVTSPGLGTTTPVPAWKVGLGKILYNLLPTFSMPNGLLLEGLSHNPAVVEAYKADPLVHGVVSARLGLDMINNGRWLVDHAAEFPPVPTLLMQGSADLIVDPGMTRRFAEKAPANVTFKMWDGLYHEMHNEPQQNEVFEVMITWLDQRV